MVNYAYQDYFYKTNMRKDILVVDGGATVTAVSGHEPSISGATYVFTTEDFKSESFELEESLCSEDDLKFGLCESSFVRIEVKNNPSYPNLKDAEAELKVYIYFNGDSDTLFQIGKYIVEKDEYSDDRRFRTIEMYDFLYYLRDYDITPWYNNFYATYPITPTIGDLRNSLFTWLNSQELGEPYSFPQETTTLINDPLTISKTIESDIITFDFFMQGILEANGCMGHVNRNGEFVYKYLPWYSEEAVKVVTDDWREPPTKYEDITTIGIGFVDIYDQNNFLKFEYGSTSFKHPSRYSIVNSFVFADKEKLDLNLGAALIQLRNKITHLRYKPCEVKCQGDLCLEVGDQINVQYGTDANGNPLYFYTYILERSFRGIQSMRDVFSAKGNKRQPVMKLDKNSNWQTGNTTQGTDGSGTGGVADVSDTNLNDMIEYWRNIGIRLLDEPTGVSVVYNKSDGQVELKWTDPADITTKRPEKVEWLGTVVVRKENSAPKHRWDGELIVNSTTRDEYKTTALVDNTVEANKRYYYGIFPYHRHLSDADNNINFFRFTKIVSVNTTEKIVAPTITDATLSYNSVTVQYTIPSGTYSYIKLVYKEGGIPTNASDGTVINITQSSTSTQVTGLKYRSTYYFEIFTDISQSEEKAVTVSLPEGARLVDFWDLVLNDDVEHAVNCGSSPTTAQLNSDDVLFYGQSQKTKPTVTDGVFYHVGSTDYTTSYISFPLKQNYNILGGQSKVNFIAKAQDAYHNQWINSAILLSTDYGQFLSHYAYDLSQYADAVHVDEFGEYEDERLFSGVQNVRRIQVRFDYGTWEMYDIKVWIVD